MAQKKSKGSKGQDDTISVGYPQNLRKDPVKDPFQVNTILEQNQVSVQEYEERFFWNEGEMKFSNIKIVPTEEEIEHAGKIIAKIEKRLQLS